MTAHDKAISVFNRVQAVTLNRYIAAECSILFADEMIKTFESIVTKYSKDFQQSVDYWKEVKKELKLIAAK